MTMKKFFVAALSVCSLLVIAPSAKAVSWSDCATETVPDSQMEGICTASKDHGDGSTLFIGDAVLDNGEAISVIAIQEPGGTATISARVFVSVQGQWVQAYMLYSSYDATGHMAYSDYPELFSTASLDIIDQVERRLYGPDPQWATFNGE
jgi:hypothetical protein